MTGGNREVARLAGIPTDRYRVYAYMISGLLASIGGIILCVRWNRTSFSWCSIINGCSRTPISVTQCSVPKPNIVGTFLGSVLIGIILNGLTMMNVPYYAQDIIKGDILITALAFSFIKRSVNKSRASNSMLYFPLQQSHELLSKQEVKDRSLSRNP